MTESASHPPAAPRPPANLNPRREPALDFPYRDFGELAPADYDAIGFMAGLEVHQQLLTRRKLFCRCPAGVRTHAVDAEVLRHMRPTLSELGEYDGTALMEFKTRKEIIYRLERGSVCTYEIDDTPPFEIDEQAVRIALEVARLFDLKLVSELHVMRKQYLDGSIPTGFQRTAMVGLGGAIPFSASELGRDRVLRIRQLSLEEDSCREVSDVGHRIVFRTDRLGVPLTETVTEPDLLTPHDAREAVRLIARVARATGKVRRGAGAARQDVNVSVAGGRRVEIKGVASERLVPRLVHVEAFRQLELLRVRAELARRGLRPELYAEPEPGLPWERSPLAVEVGRLLGAEAGETIAAVRLPGMAGVLAHRTQPGRDVAFELAERVRVIACLARRPFFACSDGDGAPLGAADWRELRRALGAGADDAVCVLWGPAADVATGVREVLARVRELFEGVPAETRQAHADGTTGFERILPGPDRMYPDTDTPPLPIPDAWVHDLEASLPARPWEREARYRELGLDDAAAARLAAAPWAALFDALAPRQPATARALAAALDKRLRQHWRETGLRALPPPERLRPLVEAVDRGDVVAAAVNAAVLRLLRDPAARPDALAASLARAGDAEVEAAVQAALAARGELRSRDPDAALRWAMGRAMAALRGRVEPARVRERLEAAR